MLRVAEKTFCVDDPASDYPAHFPGEVVVTLKNGRVLRVRKPASLGTPEVPLSRAQIEAKFLSLATRAIPQDQAEKVIGTVFRLENEHSLGGLMDLLTAR